MKQENHAKFNPKNERAKYDYRRHTRRAFRNDEKTTIAILKHLRDFEIFAAFQDFSCFNADMADKYIRNMFDRDLSLSYINENIRAVKEFLRWLERQKIYGSKIRYNDIDYLNISRNQRNTAKATEYKKSYTYQQIFDTIHKMPKGTIIEQRNKAMVSLQALCGLRISELRTMKLKNLIEEDGHYFIHVNPKDMSVKYAKTRQANFMPTPDEIVQNVLEWKAYLLKQGFTPKDPFFPQISSNFNQQHLLESKITHKPIASNTTMRDVFRKAFEAAGYEYIRPHRFRHTIARYAERKSPEFFNAVRQSLGHSSINTTFQSYGTLSEYEQRRRIAEMK